MNVPTASIVLRAPGATHEHREPQPKPSRAVVVDGDAWAWRSGSVLVSEARSRGFDPHRPDHLSRSTLTTAHVARLHAPLHSCARGEAKRDPARGRVAE